MQCSNNNCGFALPFLESDTGINCPVCGSPQWYSAEEYLTEASLGLVHEYRPGQVALAAAVDSILRSPQGAIGLLEGGCGIGKSYAYLLPALLNKKHIVISTAKKALQKQIFDKDVPRLLGKLNLRPTEVAQLYGRSNYLCLKRAASTFPDYTLKHISDAAKETGTGLIHDTQDLLNKRKYKLNVLPYGIDECPGWSCSYFKDCEYMSQLTRFREARVGVMNHWGVAARLRVAIESGLGTQLFKDALVIDEAHHFPDAVCESFTNTFAKNELTLHALPKSYPRRIELIHAWNYLFNHPDHYSIGLDMFNTAWQAARNDRLLSKGIGFGPINSVLTSICARLNAPWDVEPARIDDKLLLLPKSIPALVKRLRLSCPTLIFISATLSVNGDFKHFGREVLPSADLQTATTLIVPSPFNYGKQALVYMSKTLPVPTRISPDQEIYRQALTEEIAKLLDANGGNAFVLFTAKDELIDISNRLAKRTEDFASNLLVQRDTNSNALLAKYFSTPGATLLALKTFWSGVDIQGDKLSLVIVPRLPFPQREDPAVEIRRKAAGDNAFGLVDLPDMVIELRQGVGRLIRSKTDRGVIAILDSRLSTARYQNTVLNSLGIPNVTSSLPGTLKALTNLRKQRKI